MKTVSGLAIFFVLLIVSCSKESASPTLADSNGVLLAGAKGSSKSWKLVSISESVNGGTAQTVTTASGNIPTCEADNIFQFSNDAAQSYQDTEGATSCTAGDPNTIESGSWAFTADGKSLLIDASVNVTSTQVQLAAEPFLGFFILSEGQPLKVTQLTATSLTVSYTYVDNSVSPANTYLITIAFTKI